MDPIFEQFLSEARENLAYLDTHLEELKDGDEESINALFRAAHTLKGGAGLVGFESVKEITHAAEDLLDAFRQDKVSYSDELLDILYDAFDEVVELIDAAEESGSADVEVDSEHIKSIEKQIRALLSNEEEEKEETLQTSFCVNNDLAIAEHFTQEQLLPILEEKIPSLEVLLDSNYASSPNWYLLKLDLDSDVVELGNDPYYLLSLIEEDGKVGAISAVVHMCDKEDIEPMQWRTELFAIVYGSLKELEEIFYNIAQEVIVAPLSIKGLISTQKEEVDLSLLDDFAKELSLMLGKSDFGKIIEKIDAVLSILNPSSKEAVVLKNTKILIGCCEQSSELKSKIVEQVATILGLNLEKSLEEEEYSSKSKEVEQSTKELSDKEKSSAINILKAQKRVLQTASNDPTLLTRTKILLENLLASIGISESFSEINTNEELFEFINNCIIKLESDAESKVNNQPNQDSKCEIKEAVAKESMVSTSAKDKKSSEASKRKTTKPKNGETHTPIAKTVKIEQSQIDELMDIVGELLVMKNALPYIAQNIGSGSSENAKRELMTKYAEISRLSDQLQDRVMGMRLLPLGFIFGRYPKLVRDLSKKLGKKISYKEEGGETKLDKGVIEKLADPLVHIIRNSLDHGLETPSQRVEKGKPEVGTLFIEAKSQGDKVLISIGDDGKGIDVDTIVNKALEKNLVDLEKIDNMSKEEKLMLLFLPGLSTKEEVTDLSGRGVGTDAVKSVIDELGGSISLQSEIDKGTTTILEIPLSVALTNVFHVIMGKNNYAIDMDYIVETDKVLKSEIKTANHNPFINIRGELVPLIFEERLLGCDFEEKDEYSVVVIKTSKLKYGLVVEKFVGQLDVVQKPLSEAFENHPFINGTSLLGNGEVLFVLDPRKLVNA